MYTHWYNVSISRQCTYMLFGTLLLHTKRKKRKKKFAKLGEKSDFVEKKNRAR